MFSSLSYEKTEISQTASTIDDSSLDGLTQWFESERCVEWIKSNSLRRVALQFPDSLLKWASQVTRLISGNVSGVFVFTLADTSYGSCCIDLVAAKHANADSVIHFGRSCLSITSDLPILYIFGRSTFDIAKAVETISANFDNRTTLVVLSDTLFYKQQDLLLQELKRQKFEVKGVEIDIGYSEPNIDFALPSRRYPMKDAKDSSLLYIGPASSTKISVMMSHQYGFSNLYSYDPTRGTLDQDDIITNKWLKRRYVAVQKARDARIIGIIAGTLNVDSYLHIIQQLKKAIKAKGKKSYVFAIGKLNPEKLGNFPEVDVFVLVSCIENTFIENYHYIKPVVTPFELNLALDSSKYGTWTGEWPLDFTKLSIIENDESFNDDEMYYSLVSGKLLPHNPKQHQEAAIKFSNNEVTKSSKEIVQSHFDSASGEFWKTRQWYGLDQDQNQQVATLRAGRKGLAKEYSF